MLEDEIFLANFFEKNQRLLSEQYAMTASFLDKHGIPFYRNS
jgi:hypothetical protein